MTPQHLFRASGNPRGGGRCACGRSADEHPSPAPRRDLQLEAGFLDAAIELAERQGWPVSGTWRRMVVERLAMGQREYGDRALGRDNLPDLGEETPDLGSYPVLELQRLMHDDAETLEDDRMDLLAIAAHGAAADFYVRRIVRRRAGLD